MLDLKGTPRTDQNNLLDTFLAMTSRMNDLESTSFLSSLDMDPPIGPITSTTAHTPNGSAISLPGLLTSASALSSAAAAGLMTPPLGGGTFGGTDSPRGTATPLGETKREMFSDLRKLVSFAVRRDREGSTNNAS